MSISAERPKFEMVPHWVMDHPNVSLRGLQVYLFLRRYADYETGEAWPSRKTLASEIGVSLSTLDEAIANLRTIRAVTVTERFGERGQQSNLYTVLFYQDGGQVKFREGVTPINRGHLPRKSTSPPPGESVTEQDPLNKTQGTRQELLRVADAPGFDEFWDVFGHKNGKAPAMRAWAKAVKVVDPEVIIAGAARYRKWLDGHPDPPKQKWAQGWLNDHRWEDELGPYPRGKQTPIQRLQDISRKLAGQEKAQEDGHWSERLAIENDRKEIGS